MQEPWDMNEEQNANAIFYRYAPFIQDFIYQNQWASLRGVQLAAAKTLFDTDHKLLITSSTASGKTEAAFFPILSQIRAFPSRIGTGMLRHRTKTSFCRIRRAFCRSRRSRWNPC